MNKWYFLSLSILIFSCSGRQTRETKYLNGAREMVYEVIETENGSFVNDGDYKSWYENGQQKSVGQYLKGKKHGEWKSWFSNGQIESEYTCKLDTLYGHYVEWYNNGQKRIEGDLKQGRYVGDKTTWFENGKTESSVRYDENSTADGLATYFFPNGQLRFKANYVSGVLQGPYTEYLQTGKILKEGQYANGQQDGQWKLYNQNGEVYIEEQYEKGINSSLKGKWKVNNESIIEYYNDGTAEMTDSRGRKAKAKYKIESSVLQVGINTYDIKKLSPTEYHIVSQSYSIFSKPQEYHAIKLN